jgi:hypothetical protein
MTTAEGTDSPLLVLIAALGRRDVDAAMALLSPNCRFSTADGRRADGVPGVRELLSRFLSDLRSASYEVTAQLHQDNLWCAEVLATYEMRDRMRLEGLRRAFVMQTDGTGVTDVRVYGAHERRLTDYRTGAESYRLGGQLILPL